MLSSFHGSKVDEVPMRFASPWYLLLLLGCPLMYYAERWADRRGRGSLLYSSIGSLPQTRRVRLYFSLRWLRIAACALMCVALARPQLVESFEEITSEGIDIVLALDVSGSMAAEDFRPKNRLVVSKEVVARFIAGRRGDRIGLVAFAGVSITKCPLTTDYTVLLSLLKSVELGQLEDGTAIGNALANSANRLRSSKVKSKVIILLTDGVNNRGEIAPLDAADIARRLRIKVYAIGAGTRGMAPYPVLDESTGTTRYVEVPVEIDEDLLRTIAAKTGGRYFRATDRKSLEEIYQEIDKLEKSKIESRQYKNYVELYTPLLWFCVVMLAVMIVSAETYLKRIA